MSSTTVDVNTTLVLVNTAQKTNYTVYLPVLSQNIAQLTIRDNAGLASSSNILTVRPVGGATSFASNTLGITSNSLQLQQPFSYVTLSYNQSQNLWSVLDTFGFQPQQTSYSIQQLAVSTIHFIDSSIPGNTNLMNVSNGTLCVNNEPIRGIPFTDPLYFARFSASSMTISCNLGFSSTESNIRLKVYGTTQTNFLSLNNPNTSNTITLSANYGLYRNNYLLNPISGYLEMGYSNRGDIITTVYPISYTLNTFFNFINGTWSTNTPFFDPTRGFVSGFIALPGCTVEAFDGGNGTGNQICYINNQTSLPIYSNVNTSYNSSKTYLSGSVKVFQFP